MPSLVKVAARDSKLSRVQVEEALKEIFPHAKGYTFSSIFLKTTGDLDRKTSLRGLEKSNFFTKEIDELLLKGECRIAIHSAKDLPEPLPNGLALIALTQGVDPSDSLVFNEMKRGSVVATSSVRREEAVKELFPDVSFVDVRGTIEERLDLLSQNKVDGVVIAEAALIRLGLTHLNRIQLPGETAPLQGKLAVVSREEDEEMRALWKLIHLPKD